MVNVDFYNVFIIVALLATFIGLNFFVKIKHNSGLFDSDYIVISVVAFVVVLLSLVLKEVDERAHVSDLSRTVVVQTNKTAMTQAMYLNLTDELSDNGVYIVDGKLDFTVRDGVIIESTSVERDVIKRYGYALKNSKRKYGLTVNDLILIDILCNKYRVSMDLYLAILYTESRFNDKAVQSKTGAIGIAQILPSTAQDIHQRILKRKGKVDPKLMFDKSIAFEYSIAYIRDCIGVSKGNVWLAIRRYKGASSVDAYKAEINKLNRYIISVKGTTLSSVINWEVDSNE